MTENANIIKILSFVGKWLITTIALLLIITSLGFFIDIQISKWHFPIAFIVAGIGHSLIEGRVNFNPTLFLKSFVISVLIVITSIVVSTLLYDVSYDGQTYHMETIYQLKNGWNPFKSLLPTTNELTVFINHYTKGVELPQSAIYSMVNRIEASKATNLMLLFASGCLCLSYLLSLNRISGLKCVLISLLATLNPIAVNQLVSTCVDGQLASLLLSLFIILIWIIREMNYSKLLLFGSILVIIANIKFTGIVFIAIFTLSLLFLLLYTKNYFLFKRFFYATALSAFIAVCIVGYNPYIINIKDFHHPFYPIMGENKVDIMQRNLPKGFEDKNAASKFLISLFAHTDNVMPDNGKTVQLKIPFTLNKNDIISAGKIDSRIAGFGPLFSGALLLCLFVFIYLFNRSESMIGLKNITYSILVICISIAIIPESWWARYVPQLWYVPIVILTAAEFYAGNKLKLIRLLIFIILAINVSFTFIGLGWNIMMSTLINYQMATLKASPQPIKVQWGVFNSNRIRFKEHNVSYIEEGLNHEKEVKSIVRSNAIYLNKNNSSFQKSEFIKWVEKFQ